MLKRLLPFVAVLILAACNHLQPIYAPNDAVPPAAQPLPVDRIEADIIAAGGALNWHFQRIAAGHLVGTQTDPRYGAVVDVYFNQQTFRIEYQSSTGLPAQGSTIHEHYNLWIHNLERAITTRLANEGVAKP